MKIFLSAIALVLLCFSCLQTERKNEIDFATNKVVEQNIVDKISYRKNRNIDLVQHLYKQAIEQDADLKELDATIRQTPTMVRDSLKAFNTFKNYNSRYYNATNKHIQSIQDTIIRQELQQIFRASEMALAKRLKPINNTKIELEQALVQLLDQHNVLKLLTSQKLMDGYQEQLPEKESLMRLKREIEALNKKINSYINQ